MPTRRGGSTAVMGIALAAAGLLSVAAGPARAEEATPPAVCFAPGTPPEVVQRATAAAAQSVSLSVPSPELDLFRVSDNTRWTTTATNGSGIARGTPLTLTWSIVPDGTSISGFVGEPAAVSNLKARLDTIYGNQATWQPLFQQVFDRWSQLTGINYVFEAADDGVALGTTAGALGVRGDLRIGGHHIDGNSGILAYNFFPTNGDMVIDTNDTFYNDTANSSLKLRNVLAHEHGHGIGMSHVCPLSQTKLMEPFLSTAFDGPQLDDRVGAQRLYGDTLEANDTSGAPTELGAISTVSVSDVSIDGTSDTDIYRFTLSESRSVSLTLAPAGTSYLEGPQNGDGSCSSGTTFDTRLQGDLVLQILASDFTTVLATANTGGVGVTESICGVTLGAGTYYIRAAPGADDKVQAYTLAGTASTPTPINMTIGDVQANEGNSGQTAFNFPVTLSGTSGCPVTVNYATANGTATAGSDYTAASGTLTIAAGGTVGTIQVMVTGDTLAEAHETFTVTLSGSSGPTITDGQATGTILNDDNPVVSVGDASASEGVGTLLVPVTLSSTSALTVTVSYTMISGTATAGVDFGPPTSGSIQIAPGGTSGAIPVAVVNDRLDEPNEAFTVNITAVNATVGDGSATVTIQDNDLPPLCRTISSVPYTITAQGRYCLDRNVSTAVASGAAITVNSDFVVIDLRGFKIGGGGAGAGTLTDGVRAVDRKNVTVVNGNIRGFYRAVALLGDENTSQGHLVQNISADENRRAGIWVEGRGNVVRRNSVVNTLGSGSDETYGIHVLGPGARVINNDVSGTQSLDAAVAVDLATSHGSVVERNRMGGTGTADYGVRVTTSTNVFVLDNRLSTLDTGVLYDGGSSGKYRGNLSSGVAAPYTGGTSAGNNQ